MNEKWMKNYRYKLKTRIWLRDAKLWVQTHGCDLLKFYYFLIFDTLDNFLWKLTNDIV